jgi:hypothetical protein
MRICIFLVTFEICILLVFKVFIEKVQFLHFFSIFNFIIYKKAA